MGSGSAWSAGSCRRAGRGSSTTRARTVNGARGDRSTPVGGSATCAGCRTGVVPDFVVVPDIVAGGLASLAWSAFWRESVPAEFPAYLAVQDGMAVADVLSHLPRYAGLFVGGSLRWKLATGGTWAELARRHGMGCHIGRVGTPARVRWAREVGATSL